MEPLYEDLWIRCDGATLTIRGYYFPFATSKVIAYRDIQAVTPIALGFWTGRWRIWGTTYPGSWWHLDWARPRKGTALVLDVGRPVRPVITPADPERVAAIIEDRRPRVPGRAADQSRLAADTGGMFRLWRNGFVWS